eukprot:937161_1
MTSLQQLYDATLKLELAQQEIEIIKLEKIEYEKEISNLKEQNEHLLNEKNSYLEMNKLAEEQVSYLRSISSEVNKINDNNEDLHIQISQYQTMVKRLNLKCINLQKENKKYEILIAKLNQEKESRDTAHNKNISELQKQIHELENECNTLRKESHDIYTPFNNFTMIDDEKQLNTYAASQTISPTHLTPDIPTGPTINQHHFRYSTIPNSNKPLSLKYYPSSNTHHTSNKPMFVEVQSNMSNANTANTMITISDNYSNRSMSASVSAGDAIMEQLIHFGYHANEIIVAMNHVNDKNDINQIVECIENNREKK